MRTLSRAGFTLIELMVALALAMFLMVILTQCFVLSLETFAGMKGLGDMQQNLRSATTMLASDLAADHFEGKRRLSDPNIFNSALPIQAGYVAIKQGSAFVPVTAVLPAAPPPYIFEGSDNNNIPSFRATDHALAMTVKLKGNRPDAFFSTALHGDHKTLTQFFYPLTANLVKGPYINSQGTAYGILSQPNLNTPFPPANTKGYTAPADSSYTDSTPDYPSITYTTPYVPGTVGNPNTPGFYSSQWAEVYYYLVRTGSTEEPSNPASILGTPTFSLYRAQFVMVPDSTVVTSNNGTTFNFANTALVNSTFQGLSCVTPSANTTGVLFNSPTDVANRSVTNPITKAVNVRRAVDISPTSATPFTFPLAAPYTNVDARLIPGSGTGVSEGANSGLQTQGSTEVVLPNVISFHVQILDTNTNPLTFGDLPQTAGNTEIPPGYYDSSLLNQPTAANSAGAGFSIKAIRVTLRVWDNATRQTRQVSFTQDL